MFSTLIFLIPVKSSILASPQARCSQEGWDSSSNGSCDYTSLLQTSTHSSDILQLISTTNSSSDSTSKVASRLHMDAAQTAMSKRSTQLHKVKGDILYVVRTWHPNYDTRLPSIMKTWASTLDSSALLIVGDKHLQNPTVHAATGCGTDHHVGLTCKTGHSLALAAEKIGSRPWAFLIDDDVYVNTSNLEDLLKKHDPTRLIALGIPGCGAPHCDDHQGGFCGGGGYALSRAALKALVDRPTPTDFHNELLDMTKVFYPGEVPWDDITTTCLMKRRGITVEKIDGLYGWRLPDSSTAAPDGKLSQQTKTAIHSSNPLPLTFHYIAPQEMYTIHNQFLNPGSEDLSLLQEVNSGPNYAEQMRRYIQDENLRRSRN